NFRGSTGYGRPYVERGFGQFGSGMIDDLEDGVDWLAQQGIADPQRVCVIGVSYGGYAALWAPLQQAARLTVPLLIAHGEQDRVVPVSQTRNLVRALTRAGRPPESIFFPP